MGFAGDELQAALDAAKAGEVLGVTKALIKFAKMMTTCPSKSDPRCRDLVVAIGTLLQVPDLKVGPRVLSDLAFAFAKLNFADSAAQDTLHQVAEIAKFKADQFNPADISTMIWGLASATVRNEGLMSVIAAEVVSKIDGFDQRQLSNTAWAFAKCGLWNAQLAQAISARCIATMNTFTVHSLSHTAWAMAEWGQRSDQELLDAIAEAAAKKAHDFQPGPLSLIAWSYASLLVKHDGLMSAIALRSSRRINEFKTVDLAHLAWAFANLRIQDFKLFECMAGQVQRNITGAEPAELANIAWAFSKNNASNEDLMAVIAQESVSQIKSFKPAEMAMLAWAFAVAGLQNTALMEEVGCQVARRMDKYLPPQLSHIAWAFGALSLKHPEFLSALSKHVHKSLNQFRAPGLSNIAWAFAMVGHRDEDLVRRVAPNIACEAKDLRPLALARCAWAFRALDITSLELVSALATEAAKKLNDFPTKALIKLIDSTYSSPAAQQQGEVLHAELANRTREVASFIKTQWPSAESLAEPSTAAAAGERMLELGFTSCGMVGTPMLLSELGVDLPSGSFMRQSHRRICPKKIVEEDGPEFGSGGNGTLLGRGWLMQRNIGQLALAEVEVTAGEQQLHEWVMRTAEELQANGDGAGHENEHEERGGGLDREDTEGGASKSDGEDDGEDDEFSSRAARAPTRGGGGSRSASKSRSRPRFVAGDLPGRRGRSEVTFATLDAIRAKIFDVLGDDVPPEQAKGSVQMLATVSPCISCAAAMWQFNLLFPNIRLDFVERIFTSTGD